MPEEADADPNTQRSVRLLGPDGEDLGVVTAVAALDLANRLDLDLVPMDEATVPATYRVVDYGKWKYEQHRNGDPNQSR